MKVDLVLQPNNDVDVTRCYPEQGRTDNVVLVLEPLGHDEADPFKAAPITVMIQGAAEDMRLMLHVALQELDRAVPLQSSTRI